LARHAEIEGPKGPVLGQGSRATSDIGILENHADFAPDGRQIGLFDAQPANFDAAFAGEQTIEVHDEGGLATSVRAQQGYGFAGFEVEIDAAESGRAVFIVKAQVADFDQARHQASLSMAARMRAGARAASARKAASAPRKRRVPRV